MKLPFFQSINPGASVFAASYFGLTPSTPDNSARLQDAIDRLSDGGGGCLHFDQPGTYTFGSPDAANFDVMVELRSNIKLVGCPGVVLKVEDGLNTSGDFRFFGWTSTTTDLENVVFDGLTIDLNGENNLVPAGDPGKGNQAVYILRGERIKVLECAFLNNAGRQSVHFGNNGAVQSCRDIQIVGNTFDTFGTAVPGNTEQTDHSAIYCQAFGATVRGNYFKNPTWAPESTALEIHCSRSVVDDNTVDNVGTGINVVATVSDQEDVVYSNNVCTNVQYGMKYWAFDGFTMQRVAAHDNVFKQEANALTVIIDMEANLQDDAIFTDITFEGNNLQGAFEDFTTRLHGISVGRGRRVRFRDNKIIKCTGSAIVTGELIDGELDIDFCDNEIVDCGVTDTDIRRTNIRFNSVESIKRARVNRNTVHGTIVSSADTASGSATLSNVTNIAAWQIGMPVNGPGIPLDTVVDAIDAGASTITMSANATATDTVTVFAHGYVGFESNTDIDYIDAQFNDFDRNTIGDSGTPIELTGTLGTARIQRFDPVTPGTAPQSWIFGGNFGGASSIVLDNPAGSIPQFAIAFAGAIRNYFLWTSTQLQIGLDGATRFVMDSDQFNPNSAGVRLGLNGDAQRWDCLYTKGVAAAFGTPTAPNRDDFYIRNNSTTVTLPPAVDGLGQVYVIENFGGGTTTVTPDGSDTINGQAVNRNLSAENVALAVSDGVSDWRYLQIGVITTI